MRELRQCKVLALYSLRPFVLFVRLARELIEAFISMAISRCRANLHPTQHPTRAMKLRKTARYGAACCASDQSWIGAVPAHLVARSSTASCKLAFTCSDTDLHGVRLDDLATRSCYCT